MFRNVEGCLGTLEDVLKCLRMFRNVGGCLEMLQTKDGYEVKF